MQQFIEMNQNQGKLNEQILLILRTNSFRKIFSKMHKGENPGCKTFETSFFERSNATKSSVFILPQNFRKLKNYMQQNLKTSVREHLEILG